MVGVAGERVGLLGESTPQVGDAVALGAETAARQFPPVQRRRRRRSGTGPQRVGQHGRLAVRVACDVQVQAAAPGRLALLDGETRRIAIRHGLRQAHRERPRCVEVEVSVQRGGYVQAAGAAGHDERLQTGQLQCLAQQPGAVDDGFEIVPCRVQVEDHAVRAARRLRPGQPAVKGDGALIGEVDESRRLVDHDVVDAVVVVGGRQGAPGDVVGEMVGVVLLVEAGFVDAVGVAFQRQAAIPEVRQHEPGDVPVVTDDVALGPAVGGEQDLVVAMRLDLAAVQ